ncbi:hypothetical protein PoB_001605100 [Plakobranchus ocellatus]|uniref:Uncharacterized protein n=1 Tax=Plakobranchus ocellatus TaxID=259542 RepID=A0AAV3Z4K5_9GAST|nr:hypothetical protein PoB_001605100 [Plakobranchus ocellatus]
MWHVGGQWVVSGCPQQDDLRLSDPPSGQDAGAGARTRDRKVPADLRADLLASVPPTPELESMICFTTIRSMKSIGFMDGKLGMLVHNVSYQIFKIPLPVTTRVVALGYQNPFKSLHRLLLQCDLFSSIPPAPEGLRRPDSSPSATSTPTPPHSLSTPNLNSTSRNSPAELETLTSTVGPTAKLVPSPEIPSHASAGIANPVCTPDEASVVDEPNFQDCPRCSALSNFSVLPNASRPTLQPEQRTVRDGSSDHSSRQSFTPCGGPRVEGQHCLRNSQHNKQNQRRKKSKSRKVGDSQTNNNSKSDHVQGCPYDPPLTPSSTTSGYSERDVDSRTHTPGQVSSGHAPSVKGGVTLCDNNNTKILSPPPASGPCVDLAPTAPTSTPPHSSSGFPGSRGTLQPIAQPPGPGTFQNNRQPHLNHTGSSPQNHSSFRIPPPSRDYPYPNHNHHNHHNHRHPRHHQDKFPYHILTPQAHQPAATKTTPPPPPPPQSPDQGTGTGGRNSSPPPPSPLSHQQIPGSGKTPANPATLGTGSRRKAPAPLRPGVAAGQAPSRGVSPGGAAIPTVSAMSCPSGQACSMGGGSSSANNGSGGNGSGSVGTDVQRRNFGFGGSGTSAANTGPGKRSLQHQNMEKHMEACARMPDEDITVLDENPVLIVPFQEPEPRPSTKISLPTVKSKPVHDEMISGFRALRQTRAPKVGFESKVPADMGAGIGDTVDSKSAPKPAGTLLSRERAPPRCPCLTEGLKA